MSSFSLRLICAILISAVLISAIASARNRSYVVKQRLDRLERKVYEEAFEFRNELASLWTKIDSLPEQGQFLSNTTVDEQITGEKQKSLVDNSNIQDFNNKIIEGFKEEKIYIRDTLEAHTRAYESIKQRTENDYAEMKLNITNFVEYIELLTKKENQNIRDVVNELSTKVDERFSILNETIREISVDIYNSSQRSCGSWTPYLESCYYVFTDSVTWSQARQKCLDQRAFLAEANDEREMAFIKGLVKRTQFGEYNVGTWLGATDEVYEGIWVWDHSGSIVSKRVMDWGPGEPNNWEDENCLHIQNAISYTWNDFCCTYKSTYICEKML